MFLFFVWGAQALRPVPVEKKIQVEHRNINKYGHQLISTDIRIPDSIMFTAKLMENVIFEVCGKKFRPAAPQEITTIM